jgi:hypothetical protein
MATFANASGLGRRLVRDNCSMSGSDAERREQLAY